MRLCPQVLGQVFGEDWEEVEGPRQVHASFCDFAGKAGKPVSALESVYRSCRCGKDKVSIMGRCSVGKCVEALSEASSFRPPVTCM